MDEANCVVIGAGVIGLAIARALTLRGIEVLVLEREGRFGTQTSSHNSEVIHAGIYYEPGSLKAETCVAGRELLYAYCRTHAVPHRRCGKLIVAVTAEQEEALARLRATAQRNGVDDLEWLDPAELARCEPELAGVAALSSPSTGIIDSHAYMTSLLGDAEAHGATVAYGTDVTAIRPVPSGFDICIGAQADPTLRCKRVVNAAGLDAHRVAACIEGFPAQHIPRIALAKGNYFALSGTVPFRRLIYPLPETGGLGIHMTLDLAGRARFGPDVEWVEEVDYGVDPRRAASFYESIRRYWPQLPAGSLRPAYAGVRPKLAGSVGPGGDFCIAGAAAHGIDGLVNLFGMESPGLTASLAVADRVAMLLP